MTRITMNVQHTDLTKQELAALLWDGIELAATRGDGWADGIISKLKDGRPDMLSPMTSVEVMNDIRTALREYGRRSVKCGSNSDLWKTHAAVEHWCMATVIRVFNL